LAGLGIVVGRLALGQLDLVGIDLRALSGVGVHIAPVDDHRRFVAQVVVVLLRILVVFLVYLLLDLLLILGVARVLVDDYAGRRRPELDPAVGRRQPSRGSGLGHRTEPR